MNTQTIDTAVITLGVTDYQLPAVAADALLAIDTALAMLAKAEFELSGKTTTADHATLDLYRLIRSVGEEVTE